MRLAGIALVLALLVFGLHWPILADAGLLADAAMIGQPAMRLAH